MMVIIGWIWYIYVLALFCLTMRYWDYVDIGMEWRLALL